MTTETSKLDRFFSHPVASIVLAIAVNMLWGCAFPFIKLGYELFAIDTSNVSSIFVFAGTRFTISGLLVLVITSIVTRTPQLLPRKKSSLKVIGVALLQTSFQYAFYYSAVSMLTGKVGSLLNSSSSFLAVILAHFIYGQSDRMTKRKGLGCLVGFAGVTLACLSPDNGFTLLGAVLMIIASLAFTLSGPANKAVCREFSGFLVTGYNLAVGGVVLLILGLATGGSLSVASPFAYLDLLALCFISCVGYTMNAFLMKNNPISRIGIFGMCIPITTNLLSAVLFPETSSFGALDFLAIFLVCGGIYLVNKPKKGVAT